MIWFAFRAQLSALGMAIPKYRVRLTSRASQESYVVQYVSRLSFRAWVSFPGSSRCRGLGTCEGYPEVSRAS